ncbi:cytochrome c-type biogenesis protein CcmD, interacts with CcmCE [Klebsiella pneumoniae subsp. rhinoscleromatis]|nr:cytochrome c-type biogenesis protein CcmD, interacts with CcmCE [Klebsiella pneumoniae subsp. rhinoscleromatis]
MGGYAVYVWLAVAVTVAAFGLLTVHTLWARRALFHEVRRQQARERRIAAAREHDKEAADAKRVVKPGCISCWRCSPASG